MRITNMLRWAAGAVTIIALSASAQGSSGTSKPPEQTQKTAAEKDYDEFAGIRLGVGLSLTWDFRSRTRVSAASIDEAGIVRVNATANVLPRVMLESHYFFPFTAKEQRLGWGPFVAIQPGENQVISAAGAGLMFGAHRGGAGVASFNLGFGYVSDPAVSELGAEFIENQPAPKGADGKSLPIRYRTTDHGGFLLIASFTW